MAENKESDSVDAINRAPPPNASCVRDTEKCSCSCADTGALTRCNSRAYACAQGDACTLGCFGITGQKDVERGEERSNHNSDNIPWVEVQKRRPQIPRCHQNSSHLQVLLREKSIPTSKRISCSNTGTTSSFCIRPLTLSRHLFINIVQAVVRGHLLRSSMSRLDKAALVLQCAVRQSHATKELRTLSQRHQAATRLQAWVRRHFAMRQYVTARDAACKIQAVARGRAQHKRFLTLRSAAVTLQRVVRGRKERVVWNQIQSASLLVQTFIRAAEQRRNFLGILLFPFLFFFFFKISFFYA